MRAVHIPGGPQGPTLALNCAHMRIGTTLYELWCEYGCEIMRLNLVSNIGKAFVPHAIKSMNGMVWPDS